MAEVLHAREMLEFGVDAFLRERGWSQTCELPGSLWLWGRVIAGREVRVGKSTALALEAHSDAERSWEEENADGDGG